MPNIIIMDTTSHAHVNTVIHTHYTQLCGVSASNRSLYNWIYHFNWYYWLLFHLFTDIWSKMPTPTHLLAFFESSAIFGRPAC